MSSTQHARQESTAGIEHIDGLYGYALVLTQNRTDAEDLVQETYVRAFRAMGRLRDDSNLKGLECPANFVPAGIIREAGMRGAWDIRRSRS